MAIRLLLIILDDLPPGPAEAGIGDSCQRWAAEEDCLLTIHTISAIREASLLLSSGNMVVVDCILINPGPYANASCWESIFRDLSLPLIQIRPEIPLYKMLKSDCLTKQCVNSLFGRGEKTYRSAIRHARYRLSYPFRTIRYGDDDSQCGDLRIPAAGSPSPLCVIFHGGFWRSCYKKDMTDNLAVALARRGFVTWNVDYRACGDGGGDPFTFEDAVASVLFCGRLTDYASIDRNNIFVLGHSAGGQMALWAATAIAGNPLRTMGQPGELVSIRAAVSIAGILDPENALEQKIGDDAVGDFLEYDRSQARKLSLLHYPHPGIPVLLVHGLSDKTVPPGYSISYFKNTPSGTHQTELMLLDNADHMDPVKTNGEYWKQIENWLLKNIRK